MNRLDYLEAHHQLTQSIVGLVSIQDSFEGVKAVLDKWKPRLNELAVERYKTLCDEQGVSWEDIKHIFSFGEEE